MKVLQPLFLGAAFAVAAISIHAQTTTYTLGGTSCHTFIVDCYAVPVTNGTTRTTAWFYLAPYNGLESGHWIGLGGLGLGLAVVNKANTYSYTTTTVKTTNPAGRYQMPSSISMTFSGTSANNQPYTGKAAIVLGDYVKRCYRGCYWYYSVLGGTLTVQMKHGR
jgi:hypothetical protein